MISANELRIGNIIGWELGTGQLVQGKVYGIDFDQVAISEWVVDDDGGSQGFMKLKGVLPIPLSPEWLERFGFESTVMADYHHIKSNILLHSGHHEFWFGWNIGLNTKVEYVHQLQNLYYALTSEELELKQ